MRIQTITPKVSTKFGSLYVHALHKDGRVAEIRFSSPGKFSDTTMGEALDALSEADAVTDIIADISKKAA